MRHTGTSRTADTGLRKSRVPGSMIAALAGILWLWQPVAAEVKVSTNVGQVSVSIVRRVDVNYYLVTGRSPLEFDAQGAEWLRVYTRLWWPEGKTGTQRYKLTLWQDEAGRPIQFDVGASSSSHGPQGRKVGEWRSFFIQVPSGGSHYRLVLDEAVGDTVAVRVVEQAPKPAHDVAVPGVRALTLVEGKDTSRFYEIGKGQPVRVAIDGPCRVTVRARLNFDPSVSGVQWFRLSAIEAKGEVASRNMRVGRSPAAVYSNEPSLLPSTERTLRFNLATGHHELTLSLSGTLARSGAVRVEVVPGDKYE